MIAHAWRILVVALAGWLNRQQQDVLEYLQEENRVLREHLKGKRIRFTDDQRRRLAVKGKAVVKAGDGVRPEHTFRSGFSRSGRLAAANRLATLAQRSGLCGVRSEVSR